MLTMAEAGHPSSRLLASFIQGVFCLFYARYIVAGHSVLVMCLPFLM